MFLFVLFCVVYERKARAPHVSMDGEKHIPAQANPTMQSEREARAGATRTRGGVCEVFLARPCTLGVRALGLYKVKNTLTRKSMTVC